MWRRLAALIIKEMLAVVRDPKGRMVLIVPPIAQIVIFAFAAFPTAYRLIPYTSASASMSRESASTPVESAMIPTTTSHANMMKLIRKRMRSTRVSSASFASK